MLINQTNEWQKLIAHSNEMRAIQMKNLFKKDSNRFNNFSIKFNDFLFDFSKNIITADTLKLLFNLANTAKLKEKISAMFSGEKINTTENRAVLHTALRNPDTNKKIIVDEENILPKINKVLDRIEVFVSNIHSGRHIGATRKKITDIVNIGIGGSDLGPAMVCEALQFYKVDGINSYFISNVDGTDVINTCKKLNPETTLFVIASKTFTTQETLTNANVAKQWLIEKYNCIVPNALRQEIISKHFVALSTNIMACSEFGIDANNVFPFWDWVGGRYSLWSAIGLSIALSIGMNNFRELLLGGYEMDCHFLNTNFENNIPVIMGLLGIWYNNFFGIHTHCVVPYDQYLRRFPAFLQQLDMESNGKSITKNGENVEYATGYVVWGEIGTNAQHSFFQLIHQGTQIIPIDFIAYVNNVNNDGNQHKILLSNLFAQAEALMIGKTGETVKNELLLSKKTNIEIEELLPHKVFAGNKPTNILLFDKLTPKSLGKLIALYEHKVFVQGSIWNINQFDQWGVELGKQLAKQILPELSSKLIIDTHDSSTNSLINYINKQII
jgi:glucose-6-phosphate isomerase